MDQQGTQEEFPHLVPFWGPIFLVVSVPIFSNFLAARPALSPPHLWLK